MSKVIFLSLLILFACKRNKQDSNKALFITNNLIEKSDNRSIDSFFLANAHKINIKEKDNKQWEIELILPHDFSFEGIRPIIKISDKAKISPSSGDLIDLRKQHLSYIVTAENGATRLYKIVYKLVSSAFNSTEISSMSIAGYMGKIQEDQIIFPIYEPQVDLSKIAPTIVLADTLATINPASGVVQDFSQEKKVIYTVTSFGGYQQKYLVQLQQRPFGTKTNILKIQNYPANRLPVDEFFKFPYEVIDLKAEDIELEDPRAEIILDSQHKNNRYWTIKVVAEHKQDTAVYYLAALFKSQIKDGFGNSTSFDYHQVYVQDHIGKIFLLDRNLGAQQVASDFGDTTSASFGWFYQWNAPWPAGDKWQIFEKKSDWKYLSLEQKAKNTEYEAEKRDPCQQLGVSYYSINKKEWERLKLDNLQDAFNKIKILPTGYRENSEGRLSIFPVESRYVAEIAKDKKIYEMRILKDYTEIKEGNINNGNTIRCILRD